MGLERLELVLPKARVKGSESCLREMLKGNLTMVMVKGNLMMVMKIVRVALRLKMVMEMVKKADEVVLRKMEKPMSITNRVHFL